MPKLQKNKKLQNPVDNCMSPTARASAVDCYFSTYTFSTEKAKRNRKWISKDIGLEKESEGKSK